MLRHVLCYLTLATGLLGQHSIHADDVAQSKLGNVLDKFVDKNAECFGFSGVVLAAQNGKVICARSFGTLGDDQNAAVDTTSLFEIASATKPVTAITILILQQNGKLHLDDPLPKVLPNVPDKYKSVTVRHLIQHTSGLSTRGQPMKEAGKHWKYWNQGYSLLAEIIANVSGQSYEDCVRDLVFQPAGMTNTCFTGQTAPPGTTIATGETAGQPKRSALKPPYGDKYGPEYRGMGGMVTNVWDLFKLDRALRDGTLLNPESLQEMQTPTINNFALGWFVGKNVAGESYHHHSGSVRGFLAHIYRFPADDGCLFVLCNRANTVQYPRLCEGCRQLMMAEKTAADMPFPLDKQFANSIAGNYHDGKRTLEIKPVKDVGRAKIDWGGPITHAVVAEDLDGNIRLFDGGTNPVVTFELKGKNAISCSFLTATFHRNGLDKDVHK